MTTLHNKLAAFGFVTFTIGGAALMSAAPALAHSTVEYQSVPSAAAASSYQNAAATVDFFGYQVPAQSPAGEPLNQQWRATESPYQNPTATVDFFGYQVPAQGPTTDPLN